MDSSVRFKSICLFGMCLLFFTSSTYLTLCIMGNFSCFRCRLLTFSKFTFSKKTFRNIIRVSNGLDPDQEGHSVSPDLGPSCLQSLSADEKLVANNKERVRYFG